MAAPPPEMRDVYPRPPAWFEVTSAEDPPPDPPDGDAFEVFGCAETIQLTPVALPEGVEDLRRAGERDPEFLERLYRELRGQFADMIKVMQQASDSAGFAAQTERIRVSLVNAHVALNRLREFQGREAVIGRLRREVARKRLLVDALLRARSEGEGSLRECVALAERSGEPGDPGMDEEAAD